MEGKVKMHKKQPVTLIKNHNCFVQDVVVL